MTRYPFLFLQRCLATSFLLENLLKKCIINRHISFTQHSHTLFSQILIFTIHFFLYVSNKMSKPFYRMANIYFESTISKPNYPCPTRLFLNINIPNLYYDFLLCILPSKTLFILTSTSFFFLFIFFCMFYHRQACPLCLSVFLTGGCCCMQHPSREKESTLVNDELN